MISNFAWCAILVGSLAVLSVGVHRFARAVFPLILCHNLIWAGALTLVGTDLITFKWASTFAWLTLAVGLVAFNVGAVAVSLILDRRRPRQQKPSRWFAQKPPYLMTRPLFYAALGIYVAAFLTYLLTIQIRFGIATLILDPVTIRKADGVSYLESVPLPARLLLYLGPLIFAMLAYKTSIDRPFNLAARLVGLVLIGLSMIALLQRSNLFVSILIVCALYISRTGQVRTAAPPTRSGFLGRISGRWNRFPYAARLAIGIAGLAVVALIAFQGVGGALRKTGQQALGTGAVSEPLAASGLTAPFQYYTAGTMAFLQLVDSNNHEWPPARIIGTQLNGNYNPQTFGASTFGLILREIPGAQHVDPINAFIDTGVQTNVYTWLEPYYRDFRMPGVLVGSAAFGMLLGWLFYRRNRSQTMYWIQAMCFSTVFLAPFATRLNSALIVSLIIYVAVFSLLTRWLAGRHGPDAGGLSISDDDPEVVAGMETYKRLNEATNVPEIPGHPFTLPVGERRVTGGE